MMCSNRPLMFTLLVCLFASGGGMALAQPMPLPPGGGPPLKEDLSKRPAAPRGNLPNFEDLNDAEKERVRNADAAEREAQSKGRLWMLIFIGGLFAVIVFGGCIILGFVLLIRSGYQAKAAPRREKVRKPRD